MFGIPIGTLLGYLVTYGPQALKVIQSLGPVMQAAAPLIEKMVSQGLTPTQAGNALATHVDSFDPRSAASQALDPQPDDKGEYHS
jgi:hypothetical protein